MSEAIPGSEGRVTSIPDLIAVPTPFPINEPTDVTVLTPSLIVRAPVLTYWEEAYQKD